MNQETCGQNVVKFRGQGIQAPGFWVKIPDLYCGFGVQEQKRDRYLLCPDHSKVPASGLKDPDLGWVPLVWVKTGVQKSGLRVWPRGPKKQCQGPGWAAASFLA